MPRGQNGKSILGGFGTGGAGVGVFGGDGGFGSGGGGTSGIVSKYLHDINMNTLTKANVKNVDDIQLIIGYFNKVIAEIQSKKKKM